MIELLLKGIALTIFLGVSMGILTSFNIIQNVDYVTYMVISFSGFLVAKICQIN
jgi:hypothetical protein